MSQEENNAGAKPAEAIEREMTEQELTTAEAVAGLVQARADAEYNLFVFFEAIDEEARGLIYNKAMEILMAKSQLVHEEPELMQ